MPATNYSTAQMGVATPGGSIGNNRYLNEQDPYIKFLYAPEDSTAAVLFQDLFRGLVDSAPPAGSNARNMWEYVQGTMRKIGLSSAKTTPGIPTIEDITAFRSVVRAAVATNATDPISWLQAAAAGYSGGQTKVFDTTPKFTRQIQKALQFKDFGDAKIALVDDYFATFGFAPDEALISKLQESWNAETKKQTKPGVTEGKTSFEKKFTDKPVYTKKPVLTKSGKPKKDADGKIIYQQKIDAKGDPVFKPFVNKVTGEQEYTTVGKYTTSTAGEGFTTEEQKEFLTSFIAGNFPRDKFNAENIGGAVKATYDFLIQTAKANRIKPKSFDQLSDFVLKIIGEDDEAARTELFRQYGADIRKQASVNYMSLKEDLDNGINAETTIDELTEELTNTFEQTVYDDDPIIIQMLNFKDDKGIYRKPNALERKQLMDADPRMDSTSGRINQAVDVAQTLRSRLQLGRGVTN
jgi:hypothetical protein